MPSPNRFLAAICLAAGLIPPVGAAIVTRNEIEWQQPADFVNLSWYAVAAVCPAGSGYVCAGSLNGVNLTGWTFAGRDAVWDLLVSYGMPDTPYYAHADGIAGWFSAILSDFTPTDSDYLSGWGSDEFPAIGGDDAARINLYFHPAVGSNGYAGAGLDKREVLGINGAWFYRDPSATVPVPGTALLLAPLVALIAARRRRG